MVRLMKPVDVLTLRTLILGGEALTTLEVETWADHVHLINGYGPTECSIAAAANHKVTRNDDPATIGYGLGGLCWVVDSNDHDRLIPIGAVGELVIQGPILAREYLNNPTKTAEAFIESPSWTHNQAYQERMPQIYKTGDLVRYNADGSIRFMGRKDTQVKLRGQRIELGEIEHKLVADELVNLSLVSMPRSGPCAQKLVAVLSLISNRHEVEISAGNIVIVSYRRCRYDDDDAGDPRYDEDTVSSSSSSSIDRGEGGRPAGGGGGGE